MKKVKPFYSGAGCLCGYCKHLTALDWTCAAYPEEIPLEIRYGNVNHRVPYVDDHGIQFELREDLTPLRYKLFLQDFFGDCWGRTEEEVLAEKECYTRKIEAILASRPSPPE